MPFIDHIRIHLATIGLCMWIHTRKSGATVSCAVEMMEAQ